MKYYYKYLGLIFTVGLNIYSYIVVLRANTIETITHEHISFFYYSKSVVSPNINSLTLIASFGLLLCLIFIFLKKEFWKHFFAVLILLSLTPFIQLWSNNYYMGLGILKVEMISLIILIIHLEFNPDVIIDLKSALGIKSNEGNKLFDEDLIEIYESKFEKLSALELDNIISENKHVKEAREAAIRLIENKK